MNINPNIPKGKQTKILKRVFHFSGGTSSALMVLQSYEPGDLVIFCDTGREDPETYVFLNNFEAHEGIPIIRLETDGGWKAMLKKMKGIPNRAKRRCTIDMKIKRARRYLRSIGLCSYVQFIGFRFDELGRRKGYKNQWKKVVTMFPLTLTETDKPMVDSYWDKKPYKLNIPAILRNCDLCFQKGEDKVIAILTTDITKADKWIDDEEDKINNPKGYTYFDKHSMRQLRDIAQGFIDKGKIFNLDELTSKFSCSCTA